jgi:hypothetical protein
MVELHLRTGIAHLLTLLGMLYWARIPLLVIFCCAVFRPLAWV